jgi:hypothetical protein
VDVDGLLLRMRVFCSNYRCAKRVATTLPWFNTRSRTQKRARNQVKLGQYKAATKAAYLRTQKKAAYLQTLPGHYERPVTRSRRQKPHMAA